jgi:DNA-binding response OmpR family regulator
MNTLVLDGKDERQAASEQTELRVGLVGAASPRMRAFERRLRIAGMAVEAMRPSKDGTLAVRPDFMDVLIFMIGSSSDPIDLERMRKFRLLNLTCPMIAVAVPEQHSACLEAGADDCVLPAIDARELESRIRACIRRGPAKSKVVHVYDLTIDTLKQQVNRSGKVIHLTPREFAILEILASHRGRVVTRVMIWQRLYHETERYASNVVDVYIRYLRQKIDEQHSPALIQTVWGRGYMLRGDADNELI